MILRRFVIILLLLVLLTGPVSALPQWVYIDQRPNCELPLYDRALVAVTGDIWFYTDDIEALTHLSGPTMWRGYEFVGEEVGNALPAEIWFRVALSIGEEERTVAVLRFETNEHGVFLWYHPHMRTNANEDGEHFGWHPCAIIEVPRNYVGLWLQEARENARNT